MKPLTLLPGVLLLALSPVSALPSKDGALLPELRASIEAERQRQHVPGLSVAVVYGDRLVWSEGFGFADLEAGTRASGGTLYRIGSVSKPIVGTALMQLVEAGKVDLDAELQRYLPKFPKKRWPIHVRHLMTHTSGIRHYRGVEFLSKKAYRDLEGPMKIFQADPLRFEPGSRFGYSTYGFNLVANVVEAASGQRIGAYMREHIYRPAWMNDTALEDQRQLQVRRSKFYETDAQGRWVNAP